MNRAKDVPQKLDVEIRRVAAEIQRPLPVTAEQKNALFTRIKSLLKTQDAVLIAHFYVDEQVQILAEESGGHVADSLNMASFGAQHPASTLVVAGVRFMGETAKILSPEKRVIMPDLNADCSLDMSCPADEFSAFCDEHPDRRVVVYANTSAEVKARADWVVTSSNAIDIVNYLKSRGEKIIWASDKHLGRYIQEQTSADMLCWQGLCVVHDEFKTDELQRLMDLYPEADVLVHPESPQGVVELADVVGSTTRLIRAAQESTSPQLIVATDYGIFHKMRKAAPSKELIIAPTGGEGATCTSCAHCPWMGLNSLEKLANCLDSGANQIHVPESIRLRALQPIQRMLEFSRSRGLFAQHTSAA